MSEFAIRRSQVLSTYGVGGLLPDENASYMIASLDQWDSERLTEIPEPRLARALGVSSLRLPSASKYTGRVPVIRFPFTQNCPNCHRLGTLQELKSKWNEASCGICKTKVPLSPSRLVISCENGHLDDFPYYYWVHGDYFPTDPEEHELSLKSLGRTSSLADIIVSCSCGRRESLGDAFTPQAFKTFRCRGRRIWLGTSANYSERSCDKRPRTLQRGASNVWFPMVSSVISIPPYSESLAKAVSKHADFLKQPEVLTPAGSFAIKTVANIYGGKFSEDQILAEIKRQFHDESGEPDLKLLRRQEFEALLDGREDGPGRDFVCLHEDVDPRLHNIVSAVRRVTRLREVRALNGFSRLVAPSEDNPDVRKCVLSPENETASWLPAIENIGEGIFIALNRTRLSIWAEGEFALQRKDLLDKNAKKAAAQRNQTAVPVDIAKVAVHTLAHILIDELALDAGYPASSIRERLYVDDTMAGILIFTASADSAGSLGGLAAQADADVLGNVFVEGLRRLSWCSADPVCIESTGAGADGRNLAACHCCVYLPETSCEHFNGHLDRGLLFGRSPLTRDQALFADLLDGNQYAGSTLAPSDANLNEVTNAWTQVLQSADEALQSLGSQLSEHTSEVPEIGADFGPKLAWIADFIWAEAKVVVVSGEDRDRDEWLDTNGWKRFALDSAAGSIAAEIHQSHGSRNT